MKWIPIYPENPPDLNVGDRVVLAYANRFAPGRPRWEFETAVVGMDDDMLFPALRTADGDLLRHGFLAYDYLLPAEGLAESLPYPD